MRKIRILALTLLVVCLALAFAACGGSVKFKLNFVVDGKVYDTVDTAGQEAIALPENPTKEGDEFDGWYWDKGEWKKPFTANSLLDAPLSSDMNVYAKWKSDDKMSPAQTTDVPDLSAAAIVSADGFRLDRTALLMTVSNATESNSFLNQIKVSDKASWQVSTDMQGIHTIPSKTVPLNVGDNTFYILVTSGDGEGISLYTVTIRRRPIYTVSFETNGGTAVQAQRIEEDDFATSPTTARTGYTFAKWNYDFSRPVKNDLTVSASWTPNTDTAYTVEYYLQNAAGTGYDKTTEKKTGTTASSVTAEQKVFPHFTYKSSGSKKTGTIAPDGSLVLKLYYTRDTYTVTFDGNGGTLTEGKATQTIRYGNPAVIPTFALDGYALSWDDVSGCAAVEQDLMVTAQWIANAYTISYDLNGGVLIGNNPQTYTTEDDVTLLEPTREAEYYDFLGWYTDDGTQIINLLGQIGDLTLTARWRSPLLLNQSGSIIGVSDCFRQNVTMLEIPDSYNGVAIKSISSNAFADCTALTSVVIPSTITSIGNYAFRGCSGLTSVTIPDSVTSIGDAVFSGCSSLVSITIPFIGARANNTSSLTASQCSFGYFFGTNSFLGGTAVSQTYYGRTTSSQTSATYYFPSSLRSVTLTGGSIYDSAFYNCSMLTSITVPDSITSIGQYAFFGCSGLTTITIPDSVSSIGTDAFRHCKKLIEIRNCSSINIVAGSSTNGYIGYYAKHIFSSGSSYLHNTDNGLVFYENGNEVYLVAYSGFDTDLILPYDFNGKRYAIYQHAFEDCSDLTSLTIGKGVSSIDNYAFFNCSGLTGNLVIPDSVTSIGNYAFSGCSKLTSITIPDSITSIGGYAFRDCSGLTSVTIGDGVKSIEKNAFYGCTGLTSVTIPNSVTSIGNYAFLGCSGLTSVTIGDGVTSIESDAFKFCCKLIEVHNLSTLSITAGSSGNGYVGYYAKRVYEDGDSFLHETDDGYLFYDDETDVYLVAYYGTNTELILPDKYNGKNYAINQNAFCNCSNLTSIVLPDGVTSIGNAAFQNCSGLTSITIGNGATSIESSAFYACSRLTSITFTGTIAQWNAISKGSVWNYNTGAYTIHCTDGDIAK